MVAIGKGSAEKDLKKRSYDPVNELMCDELDWLDRVGYDPCLGADLLDGAPPHHHSTVCQAHLHLV